MGERVAPYLRQPGHVPLLIGCDCSLVVGTALALRQAVGDDVHVLYIDGDFDDAAPDAGKCQSAAAMAVWLLTRGEAFRPGPALSPSRVTVVGWTLGSQSKQAGMGSVSLQDIRSLGPREAARRALAGVSPSASILVHLDIDVFQPRDVPASYFPHADGLSLGLGVEGRRVAIPDRPFGRPVGRLVDEDAAHRGGRLQAGGRVDDVAGGDALPGLGPRFERDQRLACRDPDPDLEVAVVGQAVEDGQRGPERPLGVVFVRDRRPEKRHDRVPDELLDRTAVTLEHRTQAGVIGLQDGAAFLGIEPFRTRGEAHEVGKQDRDHFAFLARRASVRGK